MASYDDIRISSYGVGWKEETIMGTNYYARINVCPSCHRAEEEVHIGKSSYGWQFLFALNGRQYYKNKKELVEFLKGKNIYDEYDRRINKKSFWKLVEEKQATQNPSDGHFITIDGYRFMDGEFS